MDELRSYFEIILVKSKLQPTILRVGFFVFDYCIINLNSFFTNKNNNNIFTKPFPEEE